MPPQIDRFIPVSKLKYYFAVDTVYVGKKLGLLVFPYLHQVSPTSLSACREGWRVLSLGSHYPLYSLHRTGRYSTSRTPQWPPALTSMPQISTFQVAPSHCCLGMSGQSVGCLVPKVLCPLTSVSSTAMAFITYILVAGLALGTQDR